ncbi:hypothetical protein [Synechocystis sp. CACIAM 05]|jgi:hypothetical protein|uniref:hypothetical protein n=1 Tax=Synechocystis sp. CACIAM 05 TaxID=1933929 RepID=UPI00138E8023|nr:hypothetical protein [Synechocystis sp. CACIAM 05]QHV00521.1 hypothetical protein BWK47_10555 [Synechocystis sp. CACIAM 05]
MAVEMQNYGGGLTVGQSLLQTKQLIAVGKTITVSGDNGVKANGSTHKSTAPSYLNTGLLR